MERSEGASCAWESEPLWSREMVRLSCATLVLLLAGCAPSAGYRPGATVARLPVAAIAPSRSLALARSSPAPTMQEEEASAKEVSINPLEAAFAGGGALGVVFAAYCTSTGSPPTGLTIAVISCIFMAAGASIIEEGGLPKRE